MTFCPYCVRHVRFFFGRLQNQDTLLLQKCRPDLSGKMRQFTRKNKELLNYRISTKIQPVLLEEQRAPILQLTKQKHTWHTRYGQNVIQSTITPNNILYNVETCVNWWCVTSHRNEIVITISPPCVGRPKYWMLRIAVESSTEKYYFACSIQKFQVM